MGYHDLSGRPWEVMKDWQDALSGGAQTMRVLGGELPSDLSQLRCEKWEIGEALGGTNPSVCVHREQVVVSLRHPDKLVVGWLDLEERAIRDWCKVLSDRGLNLRWSPRDMNPPRLFSQGSALHMLAPWTADWAVPGVPPVRVMLCDFNRECDVVVRGVVLESDRYEKNWMPVAYGGMCRSIVYSVDPLVVLSSPLVSAARRVAVKDFGSLRGSTQVVAVSSQDPMPLLGVVHQVHKLPAGGHAYLHRFVRLDRELTRASVGRPFYLGKVGVEIAAGLCHWRSEEDAAEGGEGKLLLSYGTDDMSSERKAWVAEVGLDAVEETFR